MAKVTGSETFSKAFDLGPKQCRCVSKYLKNCDLQVEHKETDAEIDFESNMGLFQVLPHFTYICT